MAGPELFLALAGTAAAAAGTVVQGVAQANQSEFMAEIAEQQAERERRIAARQAQDFRREQSRLGARSRARRAGSGVAGRGSALLVEEDIAAETELGALDLLNNGLVSATRLEQQARLERMAGRSQRDRALLSGTSTLLSGAASDLRTFR
ncbi:MAG: hypothetical protein QNJ30_12300 [Kiloniellales bacterium]|nr:hypothetical protein [Kiloniellales bacterium]